VTATEKGVLSYTIESFYKFVGEKRLMAAQCTKCESMLLPPKPICTKCRSTELVWVELGRRGRLLTYTVIHVPPKRFQTLAPYVVGIIELEGHLRLTGMIRHVKLEEVKVGMDLEVDFDTTVSLQWPKWPRYFFKPI
jgi:hypothetical protein